MWRGAAARTEKKKGFRFQYNKIPKIPKKPENQKFSFSAVEDTEDISKPIRNLPVTRKQKRQKSDQSADKSTKAAETFSTADSSGVWVLSNTYKISCHCDLANRSYSVYYPPLKISEEKLDLVTGTPLPSDHMDAPIAGKEWISELHLGQRERHVLQKDRLLNAFNISAAIYLLQKEAQIQKLEIGGMDYQQRLHENVTRYTFLREASALQILHVPLQLQLLIRHGTKIDFLLISWARYFPGIP